MLRHQLTAVLWRSELLEDCSTDNRMRRLLHIRQRIGRQLLPAFGISAVEKQLPQKKGVCFSDVMQGGQSRQ